MTQGGFVEEWAQVNDLTQFISSIAAPVQAQNILYYPKYSDTLTP